MTSLFNQSRAASLWLFLLMKVCVSKSGSTVPDYVTIEEWNTVEQHFGDTHSQKLRPGEHLQVILHGIDGIAGEGKIRDRRFRDVLSFSSSLWVTSTISRPY